jgi:hypothetical protein
MIHDRESTEARFFDEYDKLKIDLAESQLKVMLLTDQLRTANAENQALAYKVDFLKLEVDRVTASREQYERVAIRVSAKMEGATAMMMRQLGDLQEEIKAAAFAEVPGKVKVATAAAPQPEKPLSGQDSAYIDDAMRDDTDADGIALMEKIGRNYGAGFGGSASLLPPARFGNGPINS